MFKRFARKLIGKQAAARPEGSVRSSPAYEEARALLAHGDAGVRTELARREDVEPEILYYLATDVSSEVRREVAANGAAPRHADRLLAADADDDVRAELARKIGRILPDLDPGQREKLRELTIEVIEILARDQLPRVRRIVAEEIKNTMRVPRHIVLALAKDVELIVAAPILEYSPLLNDDDLKEIIATTTVKGALEAVARRADVSSDIADAIAATLDIPAVAALLANPSAQIREETLDSIIGEAEAIVDWHQPLAFRPSLSLRAIRRIAGFVASSLVDSMIERNGVPADIGDELRRNVRQRVQTAELGEAATEAKQAAEDASEVGQLDDVFIADALDRGERATAIEGLAMLSGLEPAVVERILAAKNGQAMVALAWKAGLSMRIAIRLQTQLGHLAPDETINARNGVDYPMTAEELELSLSLFTS